MRKQDLIKAVARESKMTDAQATSAVNAIVDVIQNALAQGDEVTISGFGSYRVVERAAREGRNPRTGEPTTIAARRSPAFRAGTQLKTIVDKG
ncbi:MAG: HU family DNA-binding protein [Thermomicrobiales bacterium]